MKSFRIFFQKGIGVYTGSVTETKYHKHHATEIIYGLDGSFTMANAENKETKYHISLIPHNLKHRFINDSNITPIFIYIAPFHTLAQQLSRFFKLDKEIVKISTLPPKDVLECFNAWVLGDELDIINQVTLLVNNLTDHSTHITQIDNRILESVRCIRESLNADIRLDLIASNVHLSSSRFAHLFKDQVGIPFRRFVLWTRLETTVESILEGNSFTSACYDGGFADLSHFSKTFTDMFGVTPSSVLKG